MTSKRHLGVVDRYGDRFRPFSATSISLSLSAVLEWLATDPANAGVRGQFLRGIFPPDHGGNHAPPPTPQTPPAK